MKKLIIFAGAMLLLAAGTAGFFANRPMSAQEALILKNVEAIAQGETNPECPNGCHEGYLTCHCYGTVENAREHDWGDGLF